MPTIYDFTVTKTSGERFPLYQYEGKPMLIVNTASKCKYTHQFDDMQKLFDQYKDQGLQIIGFPCNQFAEQEPGSSAEAESFCQINYGVKFPMFSKMDVNGEAAHPLYDFLKKSGPFAGFDETDVQAKLLKLMVSDKAPEWLHGDAIKWNFTKFLIDSEGRVVKRFEPIDSIADIQTSIEQLL
ncbi:glutathione peroxidase [Paenibacillus sp. Root52]|uniref:glutathione peroxidase n=1 Tax=Paenibacillus sp. Root52 TaxID=1736552 RepID=UPI0006F69230|nr:glutathione peroxidase [Paenibacillus sp. Root52]KQY83320.1 glutathione peroxidase [Paenibacillus sp. Root52]